MKPSASVTWQHLAPNPWSYYKQLFVKGTRWFPCLVLAGLLPLAVVGLGADQPGSAEALWKKLEPFAQPPAEFAGKFGPYQSPLKFADGSIAKTPYGS